MKPTKFKFKHIIALTLLIGTLGITALLKKVIVFSLPKTTQSVELKTVILLHPLRGVESYTIHTVPSAQWKIIKSNRLLTQLEVKENNYTREYPTTIINIIDPVTNHIVGSTSIKNINKTQVRSMQNEKLLTRYPLLKVLPYESSNIYVKYSDDQTKLIIAIKNLEVNNASSKLALNEFEDYLTQQNLLPNIVLETYTNNIEYIEYNNTIRSFNE